MVAEINCPELEELAAFTDGTLSDPVADRIRQHLVECADCYEIFSESARFIQRGSAATPVLTSPRFRRRNSVYAAAASLAAAAAVLLLARTPAFDRLFDWPSSSYQTAAIWVTDDLIQPLGQEADLRVLSDNAWDPSENFFGFAHSTGPEKTAVQMGVQLIDLEVSLRGDNPKAASRALGELSSLATPLESSTRVVALQEENQELLQGGTSPKQLSGLSSEIETAVEGGILETYSSLGKWAEAGRLAAISRNAAYFWEPRHHEYMQALQGLNLPPELSKEIRTIEQLLQEEELDFIGLEQALTQIILLY